MIARLTDDGGHVEVSGSLWHDRFPVCALPAWIAFYRAMCARRAGRYARHYSPTLKALEAVARDLKGRS